MPVTLLYQDKIEMVDSHHLILAALVGRSAVGDCSRGRPLTQQKSTPGHIMQDVAGGNAPGRRTRIKSAPSCVTTKRFSVLFHPSHNIKTFL